MSVGGDHAAAAGLSPRSVKPASAPRDRLSPPPSGRGSRAGSRGSGRRKTSSSGSFSTAVCTPRKGCTVALFQRACCALVHALGHDLIGRALHERRRSFGTSPPSSREPRSLPDPNSPPRFWLLSFPTDGGLFVGLLVGVILIVGRLTFFPVLALGPMVEHLAMIAGQTFAGS